MFEKINLLMEEKKYTQLRAEITELNEPDIALLMEDRPLKEQIIIFRLLPKSIAADVFAYLPLEVEQALITSLSDKEAAAILDDLDADDATNLLEEMPANVVTRLLAAADPETRLVVNHLLQYPEDSVGSMMTVELVALKDHLTVGEAVEEVRLQAAELPALDVCYVIGPARRLKGYLNISDLLLNPGNRPIVDIMEQNIIKAEAHEDKNEVALRFQKYDLTTMPVTDKENRLVGIVTIDDVVDLIQQSATEDIEMMAAITPSDRPYLKTSVWEIFKNRIPWLMLLMLSSAFTGYIMKVFEDALATQTVLSFFIPMLMGTGGNASGQTSVTVIRSLSLGEIEFKNIFRVIWKELRVAVLCGIALAAVNMTKLMLWDRVGWLVAAVVCLTLLVSMICAKLIGCILPILAKKVGFDPAVMASPLITTIVDAVSLLVYFALATAILKL